MNTYH